MSKNWNDLEQQIDALSPTEFAEIDLKVQIAGKIVEACQSKELKRARQIPK